PIETCPSAPMVTTPPLRTVTTVVPCQRADCSGCMGSESRCAAKDVGCGTTRRNSGTLLSGSSSGRRGPTRSRRVVMSNTVKGLMAGFVATLVLSGLMLLRNELHVAPEFSLIAILTKLGSMGSVQAWMDHFVIGTVIWGLLYGAVEFTIDKGSHLVKGL